MPERDSYSIDPLELVVPDGDNVLLTTDRIPPNKEKLSTSSESLNLVSLKSAAINGLSISPYLFN